MHAMKIRPVILMLAAAAGAGAAGAQAPEADAPAASASAAAPRIQGSDRLTIRGKTYTFDEIERLPEKKQNHLLAHQMTDAQFERWTAYMQQQIEARKRSAAKLLRANQVMDELLAEMDMNIVLTEEVRQKNRARAAIIEDALRDEELKKRLPPDAYHTFEMVARTLEKDGTLAHLRKNARGAADPPAKKPAQPAQ